MRAITGALIIIGGVTLSGSGPQEAAAQAQDSNPAQSSAQRESSSAAQAQSSSEAQGSSQAQSSSEAQSSSQAQSDGDDLTIQLCDGKTTVTVDAATPRTAENGRKIADALMTQWRREHPDANWVMQETEKHEIKRPADNSDLIGKGQAGTYMTVTAADVAIWDRETYKMAAEGSRIFHSAEELGSDIAVACDTCHPNAANTHPETYPKYQVQLGGVALLRDMINWCIVHPVHGTALDPNGPKMRALEAYILAQRKGEPLNYGKR